jgi:hypothetical protein
MKLLHSPSAGTYSYRRIAARNVAGNELRKHTQISQRSLRKVSSGILRVKDAAF